MKLLIMPYIEGFSVSAQEPAQISYDNLVNALETRSSRKIGQIIELQDDQYVQNQIDSTLENFDIDNLLDPNMPNTGGMEVMAAIKSQLRIQLEAAMTSLKI